MNEPRTYTTLAHEDQLPWPTLDEVTQAASIFLDPILGTALAATWSPKAWRWET